MDSIFRPLIGVVLFTIIAIVATTWDNDKMEIVDTQQRNLNERKFNGDTITSIRELKFPAKGNYELFNINNSSKDYFAFAFARNNQVMFQYIRVGDVLFSNNEQIIVNREDILTYWNKQPVEWVSKKYKPSDPEIFLPLVVGTLMSLILVLAFVAKKRGYKETNHKQTHIASEHKYPYKTIPTITFIVIWNTLIIIDFIGQSDIHFLGNFGQFGVLLLFFGSLMVILNKKFRSLITKRNASDMAINRTSYILVIVSGLMLLFKGISMI